jgi:hypothetical protein
MKDRIIFLPPHGCIGEIAKLTGYSRTTVTNALRYSSRGLKADRVRKIYMEKYSTVKA